MHVSHRPARDPTLREKAGRLYQEHLDRWILESHMADFRGAPEANGTVQHFLRELGRLYGVRHWTLESFERAFIQGAVLGWRPGTVTQRVNGGFRILSPTCPLGAATEVDSLACRACRSFQEAVAREALAERARFTSFSDLIADGNAVCDTLIRVREPARSSPGGI